MAPVGKAGLNWQEFEFVDAVHFFTFTLKGDFPCDNGVDEDDLCFYNLFWK